MESQGKSPKEKSKRPRSKKENIDSQEENQSSGVPKKRGRKSAKKENMAENKKTDSDLDSSKESQELSTVCSSSDLEENSEQEQAEKLSKRGRPPKQTNSNSSSANSSPRRRGNSSDNVTKVKQINGASQKTSNLKSPTKDNPKVTLGKSRKRSAPTSSEESSPVKKTRGARFVLVHSQKKINFSSIDVMFYMNARDLQMYH